MRSSSASSSEEIEVPEVPVHYQLQRNSRPTSEVHRSRTPIDMLPFTQQSRTQPGSHASPYNSGYGEEAFGRKSAHGQGSVSSFSDPFQTPKETPTNYSFTQYEASHSRTQSKPLLESIELVENDGRNKSVSSDKSSLNDAKRQSRKLRKKKPSVG